MMIPWWNPMGESINGAGAGAGARLLPPCGVARDVRDEVFAMVRPAGWTLELPDPTGLKARLYSYQRRALAWMCWREGHFCASTPRGDVETLAGNNDGRDGKGQEIPVSAPSVPPVPVLPVPDAFHDAALNAIIWRTVALPLRESPHGPDGPERDGVGSGGGIEVVYLNLAEGVASLSPPPTTVEKPIVPGGLLCEEMVSVGHEPWGHG